MSIGKVILVVLATLVIFSTGLITGVVVVKQVSRTSQAVANAPVLPPGPGMQQFLHRVEGELELTPEQHQRIATILRDSQERSRGFAGGEFRRVRDQIHGELNPAQREKFERLVKERQRRVQELRSQENRPILRRNDSSLPDGFSPADGPRRPPFSNRPANAPPPTEAPR